MLTMVIILCRGNDFRVAYAHLGKLRSVIKVLSAEFYFHKPITVHLELYLFYCFIHFLLYIGQY